LDYAGHDDNIAASDTLAANQHRALRLLDF